MPDWTTLDNLHLIIGFLAPGLIVLFVRSQFVAGRIASNLGVVPYVIGRTREQVNQSFRLTTRQRLSAAGARPKPSPATILPSSSPEPVSLGNSGEAWKPLKLPPSVRRSTEPSPAYSSMRGCAGRKPPTSDGVMSSPPPQFQGRSPSACARRRRTATVKGPTCA